MDFDWILNIDVTSLAKLIPTAVSVLSAVGTVVLSFVFARKLERAKIIYQSELEESKLLYQKDLETKKSELQEELEKSKGSLQKELEMLKASLAHKNSEFNARISYEYEARKRLYIKIEPLLFQLFEASEGAFHAVTSLSRSQRKGKLPEWLEVDSYYIKSIIHRIFVPLSIYRIIQTNSTMVDMTMDKSIRLKFSLLKNCYLTFTDDFSISDLNPKIDYDPNSENWRNLRVENPKKYWRQGLVIGHVDRLAASMIINDGGERRVMSYGEFEVSIKNDNNFCSIYEAVRDIFLHFDFERRPVLGRLLICYAIQMHVLMSVYENDESNIDEMNCMISNLINLDGRDALLSWSNSKDGRDLLVVLPYIERRLEQALAVGTYVKF